MATKRTFVIFGKLATTTLGKLAADHAVMVADPSPGSSGLCTQGHGCVQNDPHICRLTYCVGVLFYMPTDIHQGKLTMSENGKAIGYVRVSTDKQADEGISLEAQQSRIEAWCTANGYELIAVHVDAGLSGKRADNRPELNAAIDAACDQQAALVVYSLSRLSRSTKDTITIGDRLDKSGADLVSLSERIDTTSAAGRMVFRMLAVLNEFERDLVSERTTAAMQHKRSKGERVGKVPFGFDLSDDGVSLVENAREQEVLVIIGELRDAGLSLRKIADELTRRGVQTKGGRTKWTHTTIARIVSRAA